MLRAAQRRTRSEGGQRCATQKKTGHRGIQNTGSVCGTMNAAHLVVVASKVRTRGNVASEPHHAGGHHVPAAHKGEVILPPHGGNIHHWIERLAEAKRRHPILPGAIRCRPPRHVDCKQKRVVPTSTKPLVSRRPLLSLVRERKKRRDKKSC